MPDAYENYAVYARDLHRMQSVSPMTPGEQESFFTYSYDPRTMSTTGSYSPASIESPPMEMCQTLTSAQVFDIIGNPVSNNTEISICERPEIKITVQPVDKFRFRYKSEMMGTHGSLLGEREETSHKKEVPTVQLINCPFKNAIIRCTLVTADEDKRFPHAHHLVRKDGNTDKDDPHDIEVSYEQNYTAMFCNMGIIHTAKKNIKEEILRKRRIEVIEEKKRTTPDNLTISTREDLEMKMEAEKAQKWMNLNSVALCFQGFCYGENNVLYPLTDRVYSRPINNLKSALTGELKICRIDRHTSSCEGNEEVWLLVEKVGKKNIKVKFYEVDEKDNIIWDADGRFSELDVHHQYAIVLKTPPYKDLNITAPKEVFVKLERPSDGEVSNSIKFMYKPSEKVLNRKRARMSTSGSIEFRQNTVAPNPQLENCVPMAETFINLPMDISNISGLIKNLLNDNNHCNSDDLREFFDNNSSIEEYLSLYNAQNLVTDGAEGDEADKPVEDFANNILRKVMQILKETESHEKSKQDAIKEMGDLLQETTNFGDTALHFSLRHEQYETAKYILLILGTDLSFKNIANMQNSSGKTPLHLAVLQNQADIVRALLKLGVDPNICDEEDASSLHNAVLVSADACIEELLKSDVKLNLESHTEAGWSALHLAAKVGSLYAVRALVAAGADVNAVDMSYGRTALHIAVDSNHKHIVNYLLTKTKINVNMKNFGGNTALHTAVAKGGKCAEELVMRLKQYGADPLIRNNNVAERDDEDRNHNAIPVQPEIDSSAPTIKSESESDEEMPLNGESSFDLARDDPKLMQLLREERPLAPVEEELQLKEELITDMIPETFIPQPRIPEPRLPEPRLPQPRIPEPRIPEPRLPEPRLPQPRIPEPRLPELRLPELRLPETRIPGPRIPEPRIPDPRIPVQPSTSAMSRFPVNIQPQTTFINPVHSQYPLRPGEEKLTNEHVSRVKDYLDMTGKWKALAQHTNQGSLVRLFSKTSSPSSALFVKLKLRNPDITVSQVKKLLIDIQAFQAASALDKRDNN